MKNVMKSIFGLMILSVVLFSCKPTVHEHVYSDKWTSNETEHWHEAICEHINEINDKADHIWNHEDYQYNSKSGREIRICMVCFYVDGKDHVHTEGVVLEKKEATCLMSGTKTYLCSVCNAEIVESIPAKGHTEDNGTETIAPTCTEKGVKTYKCTVCNEVLRTEDILAKGHSEDSGTVTTTQTCTENGVKTFKCSVCDIEMRTEVVPAGHIENSEAIVSCMTKGVRKTKCSICGGNEKTEIIEPLGWCETPIDGEKINKASLSSKYIYFGVFPKTVKDLSVTVDEEEKVIMGANTYYKGNDGEWYVKVTANPENSSNTYSNGLAITNTVSYFKVEPIKWKVLTADYNGTGKALLLAEDILTANVPYYVNTSDRTIGGNIVYANNYKYSTIRAYLNGKYEDDDIQSKTAYADKGFLQTAFTTNASLLISETVVNNAVETTGYSGITYATNFFCDDTLDKVFLLSESEVIKGAYGFAEYDKYGIETARIRVTTDYAKANYASQSTTTGYGGYWWLRSPDYEFNDDARYVSYDGGADLGPYYVGLEYIGIVPALTISLQ